MICSLVTVVRTCALPISTAPDTGLGGEDAPDASEVVEAALVDVDAFWERTYEDLYGDDYEPISGGFWPYGPRSDSPPCGPPPPDYSDIAANAFYCPSDDLIDRKSTRLNSRHQCAPSMPY